MTRELFAGRLEDGGHEIGADGRQLVVMQLAAPLGAHEAGPAQHRELVRGATVARPRAGFLGDEIRQITDAHLAVGADQIGEPEALAVGKGLGASGTLVELAPTRAAADES